MQVHHYALGAALTLFVFLANAADAPASAEPTPKESLAALDGAIAKTKDQIVKKQLRDFRKTSTHQQRVEFLTGNTQIQIPTPANTGKGETNSSLPKCKMHYGCKIRVRCRGPRWWGGDACDPPVISDCPDPTCQS